MYDGEIRFAVLVSCAKETSWRHHSAKKWGDINRRFKDSRKTSMDFTLFTFLKFVSHSTNHPLSPPLSKHANRVGVGALSGGIAAYISCPMEVAVVRLSNDSALPENERRNYKGITDTFTRIIKEEGVGAFWRGSNPFVARAMFVGVFQVATLDQFKDLYASWLNQKKNSIPNVFCSAMTAGFIYSIATMPLEASKNRMASQKPDPVTGKLPYTGTLQLMRKVSAERGFFSLYNGFLPYYLRCGGHTVSMFIIVQVLRDMYEKYGM